MFLCIITSVGIFYSFIFFNFRWQEWDPLYDPGPEVSGLSLLWHPAGLVWPRSNKGETKCTSSINIRQVFTFSLCFFVSGCSLFERTVISFEEGQGENWERFGHGPHLWVWPGNKVRCTKKETWVSFKMRESFRKWFSLLFSQHKWFWQLLFWRTLSSFTGASTQSRGIHLTSIKQYHLFFFSQPLFKFDFLWASF